MKIIVILLFVVVTIFPNLSVASESDSQSIHVALVMEVLNGGGFTYIRCRENGAENWVATTQTEVKVGEMIEYPDVPPTYNFKSEILVSKSRKIYFVPGIRKITKNDALQNGSKATQSDVYKSIDENGTYVFSDDPSKISGIKRKR